MGRIRRTIIMFLGISLAGGCEDGSVDDVPDGVLDEPRLRIELAAVITGNDLGVGQVGGIIADGEGRVYVADVLSSSQEIVVLAPDGTRVGTIGGRGEGPGEFTGLRGTLAWFGDALVTYDWRNQRLTLFDREGNPLSTWPWPGGGVSGSLLLSAGDLLLGREVTLGPAGPNRTAEVRYVRFAEEGSRSEIANVGGTIRWPPSVDCASPGGEIIAILNIPFANWGKVPGVTPTGELAVARSDEYAIDYVDLVSGDTVRTARRQVPRMRVTDELWRHRPEVERLQRLEEEAGGRFVDPNDSGAACALEELRPEYAPPFRSVIGSADGRLWVESPSPEGFEVALFDADGSLLGVGSMPERDESVAPYARGNRLYVVVKDALEVQSIEVYEVEPIW